MMKKLIFALLAFLAVPFVSFAQKTLIDAQIDGMSAGPVKLVGIYGDQNYIADSTMADDKGHFTLKRDTALRAGFYSFLLPGNKSLSILVDSNDQRFTIQAKIADLFNSVKVTGCTNTELFYTNLRFQSAQEPELGRLAEIIKKSPGTPEAEQAKARQKAIMAEREAHIQDIAKRHPDAFFTKFKIAGQNPEFRDLRKPNGEVDTIGQVADYRARFWDGVDFRDDRLLYTPVIYNKLRRYVKELTPQQRDSLLVVTDALVQKVLPYPEYFKFFANWIAIQYENGKTSVMDGEAVYVNIIQKYFKPEYATWDTKENLEKLQKHVWEMEASLLWKKGPDVRAQNQYGEFKSIYEMTAPVIVIFMFSPHCEHCQEQAPEIENLYRKWKDKGVDFYGISVSTTDAEWRAFLKKYGFTFTNVFDPTNRAIYAKYFVDNTPELYVLNKDRTIIAKNLKAEQLETIFKRELK
jgi:peroxiredoxin